MGTIIYEPVVVKEITGIDNFLHEGLRNNTVYVYEPSEQEEAQIQRWCSLTKSVSDTCGDIVRIAPSFIGTLVVSSIGFHLGTEVVEAVAVEASSFSSVHYPVMQGCLQLGVLVGMVVVTIQVVKQVVSALKTPIGEHLQVDSKKNTRILIESIALLIVYYLLRLF